MPQRVTCFLPQTPIVASHFWTNMQVVAVSWQTVSVDAGRSGAAQEAAAMKTYTIDITKTWWDHFTSEAICEDAEVGSSDETLHRVGLLLEAQPIKVLANHLRYELPEELVHELHSQASWYAWFWGEELAESESENRMTWLAWGRGSAAFARKLSTILEAGK